MIVSSAGVSGLDEIGVSSGVDDSVVEGMKLEIPLDSLAVLGEIGGLPDKILKPRSYKILAPMEAKCSGSRPDRGKAIDNAILLLVSLPFFSFLFLSFLFFSFIYLVLKFFSAYNFELFSSMYIKFSLDFISIKNRSILWRPFTTLTDN